MTKSKSWRDVLPIHPAADLFPLMAPDELKALGEDIKKNGLTSPIAFVTRKDAKGWHYQLLDGRNRLDAMELVGVPFKLTLLHGECLIDGGHAVIQPNGIDSFQPNGIDSDPYLYVISANIHRRHLTAEQKRELIAKVLKATPEKSDRQIAETAKTDHKTVASVRAEQEARGEIPHVSTRTDSKGRQQPARKTTTKPPQDSEGVPQQRAAQPPACLCPNCACSNDAPQETKAARDDIGTASNSEIARKDARIEELQAEKRRLEIENVGLRSEVEEAKAARKPEDEGNELGNLLQAWDRASQSVREKFKVRVGLVAVDTPVKAADDGLDIPDWRRTAP